MARLQLWIVILSAAKDLLPSRTLFARQYASTAATDSVTCHQQKFNT
jgi:hypothetical protein